MSKRKGLKAYVRLDKAGQPVAGSMIYRDKQPYGRFVPLVNPSGDVCCGPSCPDPAFWLLNVGNGTPSGEGGSFGAFQMFRQVDECTLLAAGDYYDGQAPGPDGMALYSVYPDGTVAGVKKVESTDWPGPEYYKLDSQGNRVGVASANRIGKWDKNNNMLWYKRLYMDQLPFPSQANAFCFTLDANDYIYVGLSMFGGDQNDSMPILKLDPNGNIVASTTLKWTADVGWIYTGAFTIDLETDINGNLFILALVIGTNNTVSSSKSILIKLDSDLNYVTNYRIDTNNPYARAFSTSLVKDNDGNFVISYGYPGTYPYNFDTFEGYVKFNPLTGTIIWANTLIYNPLSKPFNLPDIVFDASNNLFMTICNSFSSDGSSPGEKAVVKMDANGVLQWAYKITATTEPYGLYDMWTNQWKTSSLSGDSYLSCSYANYYGQLYRLPLTPVTGTYGTFVFTDITSTLTQTTTTFPIVQEDIEVLSRTYSSEDLAYNQITINTEQTLYNI